VLDRLGEGAMGVVYRARDRLMGRVVALKMLSEEFEAEAELHQRFQREGEAIGQLNHPNIVSVYDMGEADGHLYIAMELIEGDDLRTLIEKRVPLPIVERVRIFMQICAGLDYAHERGIVHRDVKPANIIVTTLGRVKLLDFGLARLDSRASITRRGVILGTPDYMAPEQAQGRPIDARTDLFAAGAVLYEFLTQHKPFRGKTLHSVLYQIISGAPEPVLTLNPEVPARLAACVHRMLAKDPSQRQASLAAVAHELGEVHALLRRTRGRTVVAASPGDESRLLREHLRQGRALFESGHLAEAAQALELALALAPDSEDAAGLLWQVQRRLRADLAAPPPAGEPAETARANRIEQLLAQAAAGVPEQDVRRALAELALIAPDDTRVRERLRGPHS
jgi:serine/threonine-protein kinase